MATAASFTAAAHEDAATKQGSKMRNSSNWLVVAAAACLAAPALAQEPGKGSFQLTPYAGFAHVRISGENLEFGDTETIDGLAIGAAIAWRASFGLVTELGLTTSTQEEILGTVFDFSTSEYYLGVGYQ